MTRPYTRKPLTGADLPHDPSVVWEALDQMDANEVLGWLLGAIIETGAADREELVRGLNNLSRHHRRNAVAEDLSRAKRVASPGAGA